MRPWFLVASLCFFIYCCNSGAQGNEWTSQAEGDQTVCQVISQAVSSAPSIPQGSATFGEGYWCITSPSQLERVGVSELDTQDCSTDGLAVQPMRHMGFTPEGELYQLRQTLVNGLEETPTQIAKSAKTDRWSEGRSGSRARGSRRERADPFYGQDPVGGKHTEFQAIYTFSAPRILSSGGHQPDGGGGHTGVTTGACPSQASTTEFDEGHRTSQGAQGSYGSIARRAGGEATTARSGETSRQSSQPCTPQSLGEVAAAVQGSTRKGDEVGRRLEEVCLSGPGAIHQTPVTVCGDSQAADPVNSRKTTGGSQRRDIQSFLIPAATDNRGGSCGRRPNYRRWAADDTTLGSTRSDGSFGRLSRGRHGNGGDRWSDVTSSGRCSQGLHKKGRCRVPHEGCQGSPEAQRRQKDRGSQGDGMTSCDVVGDRGSVSIDCVVEDVFAGHWPWNGCSVGCISQPQSHGKQVRFNPMLR